MINKTYLKQSKMEKNMRIGIYDVHSTRAKSKRT